MEDLNPVWMGLAALAIFFCCAGTCAYTPYRFARGRRDWPVDKWLLATSVIGLLLGLVTLQGWPWPATVAISLAGISLVFLVISVIAIFVHPGKKRAENFYPDRLPAIDAFDKGDREVHARMLEEFHDTIVGVEPYMFDGIALDLVADLREGDLIPFITSWGARVDSDLLMYHELNDKFKERWFQEKVGRSMFDDTRALQPFGPDGVIKVLQHVQVALFGDRRRDAAFSFLIRNGFIDPGSKPPHLTRTGKAARAVLLRSHPLLRDVIMNTRAWKN